MTMNRKSLRLAIAALALALAACAAPRSGGARYADFLGEPVENFRFVHLLEWHPVDENAVVLRFDRNRYYALMLRDPCIAHAREASRLALDSVFPKRLRVHDRVLLDGRRCIIDEIRPLDHDAYRAAGGGRGAPRPVAQPSGGTYPSA